MTSQRRLLKLLAAGAAVGPARTRHAAAAGNQRLSHGGARECDVSPWELRVEWRPTPTGIDTRWPRPREQLHAPCPLHDWLDERQRMACRMLGSGFFNVEKYPGRYTKLVGSFGRPKLILRLSLFFADGAEELVVTDGSPRTHPGPITFSEDFDARLEPRGWDRPGFDPGGDNGWSPAVPPIRRTISLWGTPQARRGRQSHILDIWEISRILDSWISLPSAA